ncbi:MAG: hypothetical protein ACFCUV_02890 [Rivularia sp. (in: cyanobacteria)]
MIVFYDKYLPSKPDFWLNIVQGDRKKTATIAEQNQHDGCS